MKQFALCCYHNFFKADKHFQAVPRARFKLNHCAIQPQLNR
jgi:hypothetical protein